VKLRHTVPDRPKTHQQLASEAEARLEIGRGVTKEPAAYAAAQATLALYKLMLGGAGHASVALADLTDDS